MGGGGKPDQLCARELFPAIAASSADVAKSISVRPDRMVASERENPEKNELASTPTPFPIWRGHVARNPISVAGDGRRPDVSPFPVSAASSTVRVRSDPAGSGRREDLQKQGEPVTSPRGSENGVSERIASADGDETWAHCTVSGDGDQE